MNVIVSEVHRCDAEVWTVLAPGMGSGGQAQKCHLAPSPWITQGKNQEVNYVKFSDFDSFCSQNP